MPLCGWHLWCGTTFIEQALHVAFVKGSLVHAGRYIRGIGAEVQFALLPILRCGQHGPILFTPPRSATSFTPVNVSVS